MSRETKSDCIQRDCPNLQATFLVFTTKDVYNLAFIFETWHAWGIQGSGNAGASGDIWLQVIVNGLLEDWFPPLCCQAQRPWWGHEHCTQKPGIDYDLAVLDISLISTFPFFQVYTFEWWSMLMAMFVPKSVGERTWWCKY